MFKLKKNITLFLFLFFFFMHLTRKIRSLMAHHCQYNICHTQNRTWFEFNLDVNNCLNDLYVFLKFSFSFKISPTLTRILRDVPSLSRCDTLKNPHWCMVIGVLYRSNAIVSPYWRRLNMSETFLVGQTPKTNKKTQGPVSHEIYNDKNYGLRCERMHTFCTTSLIMVTSPFELNIIELANSKWWNDFF